NAVGTLFPAAVGHGLGGGVAGQPAARFGDADGEHFISFSTGLLAQGTQPGRRRNAADLVLAGNPAEKQRNAQFLTFTHAKRLLLAVFLHTTSLQLTIIPYSGPVGYMNFTICTGISKIP